MTLWMEVTTDEFELPVAVARTAEELAKMVGRSSNSISSAIHHARTRGYKSRYVKVEVDDRDAEEIESHNQAS